MTSREKIDLVLDNFNFEKVHKVMVAMDWEWFSCDGVPEICDLRIKARQLLLGLKEDYELATGGFYAKKKDGDYSLSFRIDDINSYELMG